MSALHDLVAPPARPRFREELWERAAAGERRRRHVRRAGVIAAGACVVAATASAGVVTFQRLTAFTGTYDRSMSCPVPIQGGTNVVRLQAHASYSGMLNGNKNPMISDVGLVDGRYTSVGGFNGLRDSYRFPANTTCKPTSPVPAGRSGLPLYEVFKSGEGGLGATDNGATCLVGPVVRVRQHAVVRNGRAQSATLTMWTGTKKLRPVVFVDWTPKRVAVYFSDDCYTS